jgi:uncharacterized RDD family membrane protein YckC
MTKASAQPAWRREASNRLHSYRVRRGGAVAIVQMELPFRDATNDATRAPIVEYDRWRACTPPKAAARAVADVRQRSEHIALPRHEPAPVSAKTNWRVSAQPAAPARSHNLVAVASLTARGWAALLDGVLLLSCYGGMIAFFWTLGGRIEWTKLDALIITATLVLFYAQYFALFTVFGGSTPGMMLAGLRVVRFDGGTPTSRQMMWRSLGYLIAAATCFLAFLWALYDDDQLCWQDRLSETYITTNDSQISVST